MRRTEQLLLGTACAAIGLQLGTLWAAARPRPSSTGQLPLPPPGLPPGRVVAVPGRGEFFVREAAGPSPDAPTVVLAHGWMFPADLHWFRCYGPLSESYRVIAMDHRGHGRGLRAAEPFRLVDVADDIAALLAHLETPPVVAVGYSMGGPIAQLLWQRHPGLVRGLVLCASSAHFNEELRDRLVWRGMGLLQIGLRLLPRHWMEQLVHWQASGRLPVRVTRMLEPHPSADMLELLPWMIGEFDRDSAEDVAEAGRELSRYDARGWLPTVDVPTAVLITTRDQLVPVERQRAMAASIRDAGVTELDLDHDGAVAGADVFVPALLKAIAEVC
ncbi:MAG: alpha/beta fold hydrolase [Egibacteraceae bacterium]